MQAKTPADPTFQCDPPTGAVPVLEAELQVDLRVRDLWMGAGGEGAKFWISVLIDLKNRGVRDVFFLVCDGLKGLPEVITNVWSQTIVQTCIAHLIRNIFRLVARQDWDAVKRDIKPIYTAPSPDAALIALDELEEKWRKKYGAMVRLFGWAHRYNTRRRHSHLGQMSPIDYENSLLPTPATLTYAA